MRENGLTVSLMGLGGITILQADFMKERLYLELPMDLVVLSMQTDIIIKVRLSMVVGMGRGSI